MLALDSLVIDLIFQQGAAITPDSLFAALGGEEAMSERQMLDPDMQDPRFELELSPSRPFRRASERRLMIVDPTVAPMRQDPRSEPVVPLDLRAEKERLIQACEELPVRVGRISALGSWGDAVLVARSAKDLRALALLTWLLDPTVDTDGQRRANQLSRPELEEKIMAYDKRIEELDEEAILARIHTGTLERRGELLILDVLAEDGTWDMRESLQLENELAAVEAFSVFPGAPSSAAANKPGAAKSGAESDTNSNQAGAANAAPQTAAKAPAPAPALAPLRIAELAGRVALVFPPERFDLDVAAALGKRDYEAVITSADAVPGQTRDRIYRDGAYFVAPLEFLSEVFWDGKPLAKPVFEANAEQVAEGVRSLAVHCPRFGPAVLVDIAGRGRFLSSAREAAAEVAALVADA
ncbi:hypothetical protein [Haliangium ochraceum]|uniref:Uncharacterized protein n=1 Tax=Haliangium ochraceum (strain DSM 14365 / JCM 11303 / SMP-2) TaxID=502025 RepID=D0LJL1_HALO1|nr:hypothetical protein [Haliangium ochraceum]ACY16585.1 hypothetical protein Hoch_4087 [Haliangium ochraceum DSM 14365]